MEGTYIVVGQFSGVIGHLPIRPLKIGFLMKHFMILVYIISHRAGVGNRLNT